MIQRPVDDTEALQRATARAVGNAASAYGHALVETLRKCRRQTRSNFDRLDDTRPAIDTLYHGIEAPDMQPPAGSGEHVIHSTAWLNLGQGIRHLRLRIDGANAVAAVSRTSAVFHDAYGEVICEFPRGSLRRGGIVLAGPHTHPAVQGSDADHVRSATGLVRLTCRTEVDGPAAAALQRLHDAMHIAGPPGTMHGRRPAAVELWEGDEDRDVFLSVREHRAPGELLAPRYYANLCHAFAQWPVRANECHLVASLRKMGLMMGAPLEWRSLRAPVREGLVLGFEDAAWQAGLARAARKAQPAVQEHMAGS